MGSPRKNKLYLATPSDTLRWFSVIFDETFKIILHICKSTEIDIGN